MIRNQNQFTVTLTGTCPQTLNPISLTLKQEAVPHSYNINSEEISGGGGVYERKLNRFLTLIPILILFFHVLLTRVREVGALDYWVCGSIRKLDQLVLGLLFFPLHVAKLPVISPCTITVILRSTPFVLFFKVISGSFHMFYIWNHRLLGNPFRNLSCLSLG